MREYKKLFRMYYNKHHREKTYDVRNNFMLSNKVVVKRLGIKGNSVKLLDIGCGTGELLKLCKDKKISAYGIDISIEGLHMTRQYDIKNLILGDQEFLPCKDKTFDYITLIGALEYCLDRENIRSVLKEIKRVARKDARIYAEVRNGNFILFKLLKSLFLAKPFIADKPAFKYKRNTIKAVRYKDLPYYEWNELFEKGGFKIERIWKAYTPLLSRDYKYVIKTLIVKFINLVLPASLCYKVCYLCKKNER